MNDPKLSVVVAGFNSAGTIRTCLEAIRKSAYRDYEIIFVDDGSSDGTQAIARAYADSVIPHAENLGRLRSRFDGFKAARGEIIVNIDSDVLIPEDALGKIYDFFARNPEVDALTGLLAKDCPHPDFVSQYKNLYMHDRFMTLPECVTFLYGSIFAVRKTVLNLLGTSSEIAEDTAWGQDLIHHGKKIFLMRDLQVVHLKKYDFLAWAQNDFRIPYYWGKLFFGRGAWRQTGRFGTGFAHASLAQIASLLLAPVSLACLIMPGVFPHPWMCMIPAAAWFFLNGHFFLFLKAEKGTWFAFKGIIMTFLDHLIMVSGVIAGAISILIRR